jgi:hypothetical protein
MPSQICEKDARGHSLTDVKETKRIKSTVRDIQAQRP